MINLSITGDTEQEVERLAEAAGLTPGQWLRVAIASAILEQAKEPDPFGDWPGTWVACPDQGKALSSFIPCQDPSCPDSWAEHQQHDRSGRLETAS